MLRSLGLWSLPFFSTLAAMCFWDVRHSGLPFVGSAAWCCAFLIGTTVLRSQGSLGERFRAAWQAAAIASIGTLALPGVEWMELQGPDFGALASTVALTASVFGIPAEAVDGRLFVNQGRLDSIPLGSAQVGLAPATLFLLAACCTLIATEQARIGRRVLQLSAWTGLWMVLRVAVTIGATSRIGRPMLPLGDDGRWFIVRFLVDGVWTTLSIVPLVMLLASRMPWAPRGEVSRAGSARLRRTALAGMLVLMAVPWTRGALPSENGPVADGGLTVLVDDFKSSKWSSASKPLDRETATRSSVYGYAALVTYLGQWHDVSIHRTGAYTSALLSQVDVLVLKPALRKFGPDEIRAIHAFVEAGGGLWVLGDHTDLLGSSTVLNEVIRDFGVELRKDACNQLSDGRTHHWSRSPWDAHWIAKGLGRLNFLTSCSLELSGGARPVLVSGDAFSDPVDYSGESFFGDVCPDMSDEVGPLVVAASSTRGEGRVMVFGDSTIFSAFCLTYGETERFALRCMAWLGGAGAGGGFLGIGAFVWLGLQFLLGATAVSRRVDWPLALMASTSALWILTIFGQPSAPPSNDQAPGARSGVVFLEGLGDYELPVPVLEYAGDDRDAFDTCFTWVHRVSAVPDVRPWDELRGSDVGVLVRPSAGELASGWQAFEAHLRQGGVLVVLGGEDPRAGWARSAGAGSEPWGLRSHPLGLKAKAYAALGGTVLWIEDADLLSRQELGTSFDDHRPRSRAWRRNEWCLDLWEWALEAASREIVTERPQGLGLESRPAESSSANRAS